MSINENHKNNTIQNALISVSDKAGILDFVKELVALQINIYSTGGTKKYLLKNGIGVKDLSVLTQFPEILDGRVKTLHPHVHAGILAKRDVSAHCQVLSEKGIQFIDLVVVNLYPFAEVVAKKETLLSEAIENIDIGGPTLLRSAAKNYRDVTVACSPSYYNEIIKELQAEQTITLGLREKLAIAAFHHVAKYDTIIDQYLQKKNRSERNFLAGLFRQCSFTLWRKSSSASGTLQTEF